MSQNTHPFLRVEILKFNVGNSKHATDLSKLKTEIEKTGVRKCCFTWVILLLPKGFGFDWELDEAIYNERKISL